MIRILWCLLVVINFTTARADRTLKEQVDQSADRIESKVIEWRRHFHRFPELSNREFKTAKKVAEHLTHLGLEVETGIAHTGVVGLLKGGKPGPIVALRADMDALPVTERVDVPFASKVRARIQRAGCRSDARLRPRYAHGHSNGCCRDTLFYEK